MRHSKGFTTTIPGELCSTDIGVFDAPNRLGQAAVDSITKELVGIHEAGSMSKVRKQDLSAE
jgi:hypothetical protein